MSLSTMSFQRWTSREHVSWPFQIYKKYNKELSQMYIAHIASHEYVYRNLGKSAIWDDPIKNHFTFKDETQEFTFQNVRSWSESYNALDNWVNLNSIMAMSSNLETYMTTIIKLSLESDVGVLFGAKHKIDGIKIIKHSGGQPFDFEDKLMSCTKGEWGSRVRAFEKIFGDVPSILIENISSLEKLRNLRNDIGHAFGRDIKSSREHGVLETTKIRKLSRDKTLRYQKLMYGISSAVDKQLLFNHIGEYQTLYFYHNLKPSLKKWDNNPKEKLGQHTWLLKKEIGRFGATKVGKKFCNELIKYYDSL